MLSVMFQSSFGWSFPALTTTDAAALPFAAMLPVSVPQCCEKLGVEATPRSSSSLYSLWATPRERPLSRRSVAVSMRPRAREVNISSLCERRLGVVGAGGEGYWRGGVEGGIDEGSEEVVEAITVVFLFETDVGRAMKPENERKRNRIRKISTRLGWCVWDVRGMHRLGRSMDRKGLYTGKPTAASSAAAELLPWAFRPYLIDASTIGDIIMSAFWTCTMLGNTGCTTAIIPKNPGIKTMLNHTMLNHT